MKPRFAPLTNSLSCLPFPSRLYILRTFEEPKIDISLTPRSFLLLFVKYVAAIGVSYFVSYIVFFVGMFLLIWAGMLGIVLLFIASGFCGVFVGTLCLPQSGRRFGSAVLLLLGVAYYVYFVMNLDILRAENNSFPFMWLVPLVGGGVIALILIRKMPSLKSLQILP